jgi:hypothetical protein
VSARAEYDPPIVLREGRVQPTARLQLREVGFGSAARRLGIDAVGEHVLGRLTSAVNGRIGHQLLGRPPVVQDDPRQDGQVAPFHIAHTTRNSASTSSTPGTCCSSERRTTSAPAAGTA